MKTLELTKEQIEELSRTGRIEVGLDYSDNLMCNLEIVKKNWEPRGGAYQIGSDGLTFYGYKDNPEVCDFGMSRRTKENATKAAKKMRTFNRLLAYVDEFDPDFEFKHVENDVEHNWLVFFDQNENKYDCYYYPEKFLGAVFMSKEVARELCRKLNSGDVEL
ncbi:hypothetical protein [Fangia hongkongensis]|uniref:hypothetical protein n=1 Tax=Fangia hongkongensis TaxID=270495 RepID=UPI0003712634|nr:hypothetical protein [Fangia hongkongensis]MBK2126251.1 hypothetical protein [Fangia hongkongensis]